MMNDLLNGKTVLIFGADGLLGKSIAEGVLRQGAILHAVDRNLDAFESEFWQDVQTTFRGRLIISELDVNNTDAVTTFFNGLEGISGFVNATYPKNDKYGAHFFDVTMHNFNDNLSLNLGSCFLIIQQVAKYFLRQEIEVSLVNLASVYGEVTPRFKIYEGTNMTTPVEYVAIKSALIHLTKYVSKYVCHSGFRANCVAPGGILDGQPEQFLNAYRAYTNGKGMLDSIDVVGSVVYLLSDLSRFVNGQCVLVDDGFSL